MYSVKCIRIDSGLLLELSNNDKYTALLRFDTGIRDQAMSGRGYAKRDRPRDTITRGNRTWEWGTGVWKIRLVGC